MRVTRAALGCLLLSGGAYVAATAEIHSMGTLVSCPADRAAPCLWAGENGQVIDAHALRSRMLAANSVGGLDTETAARNLERHMTYLESK
uniref:SCP domain-containing protein n=1 Tax=Globisporangium ultimum (strain ATCC 200006 / CBS 805.95 / DAOM BR144) TaxID=431595 RepID=K3W740_GLOUD